MTEKHFLDRYTNIDNVLQKILEHLEYVDKANIEREFKVSFFTYPSDASGSITLSAGTTVFDFAAGTTKGPDNVTKKLSHSLPGDGKDILRSFYIFKNQEMYIQLNSSDWIYSPSTESRIKGTYQEFSTLKVKIATPSTFFMLCCTNPEAIWATSFSDITTMTQTNVDADPNESQTWDVTLTSLISNLNRIRHQIITITGLAWGSATPAVLKSTFNANTILYATSNNTPVALTLDEQRILGRITGGVITGLTATQMRTFLNVEDGSTADQTGAEIKALYEAEVSAFTDAQFTKLSNIATAATKYPDTGEQAFLDADHTKLDGIATGANLYTHPSARACTTGNWAWADVTKTGSSLADLATRSAGDLNSGDLASARMSTNVVAAIAGLDPTFTSLTFDSVLGIKRTVDNSYITFLGATLNHNGASLGLYGGDYGAPGKVEIIIGDYRTGRTPDSHFYMFYDSDETRTAIIIIDKSGNITTVARGDFSAGVRLGTAQDANHFDDASHGSASTTMYIGNKSINTTFTGCHYYQLGDLDLQVGELVKPTSSRCVLPPGVYVVERFIPPTVPFALDGTVFVKGERYGVSAEYLTFVDKGGSE